MSTIFRESATVGGKRRYEVGSYAPDGKFFPILENADFQTALDYTNYANGGIGKRTIQSIKDFIMQDITEEEKRKISNK